MKRSREQIKQDLLNDYRYKIINKYFNIRNKTEVIDLMNGQSTLIVLKLLFGYNGKKYKKRKEDYKEWKPNNPK